MASASSSAQAAFGLGRRKKNPGLLDQIGKFFGGDKKRKSKVRREGRGQRGREGPSSQASSGFLQPDYLCFFSFVLFCFVFTVNLFLLLSLKDLSHDVTDEGAERHWVMTLGAGLFSFVVIC